MIVAQLLEQFQATAVGQHHVQYHGCRGGFGQGLAGTLAIVTGPDLKTFLAQPAYEELTQLLVIVYQ
ncbi:hypothetical protein D3C76_1848510 [compost metagenome]